MVLSQLIILLMQIFHRSSMKTGFKTNWKVSKEGRQKKQQLPEGMFGVGP